MFAAWIPTPLHPAVVHLPIALAVLLPLVAVVAWVATLRGARPLTSWSAAVAASALLVVSSWVALETGEDQEDAVEDVVPGRVIHQHEEAAETFLGVAVALLGVSVIGLLPNKAGAAARGLATVGTLGVLVAGWRVGHSGGELVYKHGAAQAYVAPAGGSAPAGTEQRLPDDERN